mmetsp:Transcript_50959/g.119503  ORF Transcript_50959/g.119503 Transcript_50959/m.119503 type:complete len:266 (+) Transcript_50959:42-839(+)
MRVVAAQLEVLEFVVEDRRRPALDRHRRVGPRLAGELGLHLFDMVVVDVAVAAGPDEVAQLQLALLGQHHRQQRIAGDVEGHAEEDVRRALVELAAQLAVRHVELEEGVAGHQRHLGQVGHVPGADDDAAAVRVGLERLHDVGDLVDMAAVRRRPAAPLHAVDRAEVAIRPGPLVPDRHAALLQPLDVAVAAQEPQQLQDDGFQMHLLRRHQREASGEVEAHLVAKHAARAGAGAVALLHAMLEHMAHEVFVLAGGRRHGAHFQA